MLRRSGTAFAQAGQRCTSRFKALCIPSNDNQPAAVACCIPSVDFVPGAPHLMHSIGAVMGMVFFSELDPTRYCSDV
jgi:hypothetical protein